MDDQIALGGWRGPTAEAKPTRIGVSESESPFEYQSAKGPPKSRLFFWRES